MDKWIFIITLKVLKEVTFEFPQNYEFIEDCVEQECLKENMPVEEVIFFTSLEAKSSFKNFFHFMVLGFKAKRFWLELCLTKYVKG